MARPLNSALVPALSGRSSTGIASRRPVRAALREATRETAFLALVETCGEYFHSLPAGDSIEPTGAEATRQAEFTRSNRDVCWQLGVLAAFDLLIDLLCQPAGLEPPEGWMTGQFLPRLPTGRALLQHWPAIAACCAEMQPFLHEEMPPECFGDLYEFLLDYTPHVAAKGFTLSFRKGKRQARGVYYTPPDFVEALLDEALTPVVRQALGAPLIELSASEKDRCSADDRPGSKSAILNLRICDPACGGGRFLLAAGRRLASELMPTEPAASESSRRQAFRAVDKRCLYGVDLDPIAVALCRLALWWEGAERGTCATKLNAHIRCGDGLLGVGSAPRDNGIPAAFFRPLASDDRAVCRELRERNAREWRRDTSESGSPPVGDTLPQLRQAETERLCLVADLWCAAAVWPKNSTAAGRSCPTSATLVQVQQAGAATLGEVQAAELQRLRARHRFLHWPLAFPEVFSPQRAAGFDLVVGNPPFTNAIDGGIDERCKRLAATLETRLRGTADWAFRFLARATELIRPGGYVAMVQPRAALNAPALGSFRVAPGQSLQPRLLFASTRSDAFRGAAVYVSLIVLGPPGDCRLGCGATPAATRWRTRETVAANWWSEVAAEGGVLPLDASTLPADSASIDVEALSTFAAGTQRRVVVADEFEVAASMTTGEAYRAVPFIQELPFSAAEMVLRKGVGRFSLTSDAMPQAGFHFITTGLIDPDCCQWESNRCRYLGRTLTQPWFLVAPEALQTPGSLAKRIALAARPKILVAGLSARLECFLDAEAICLGAVSTYTITHPRNDVERLRKLCQLLLSAPATALFRSELGGNALGGGNITMKKSFLQTFPW